LKEAKKEGEQTPPAAEKTGGPEIMLSDTASAEKKAEAEKNKKVSKKKKKAERIHVDIELEDN